MGDNIDKIKERRARWVEQSLNPALKRFKLKESPTKFYTPEDTGEANFLDKIGFPGEYPFTAGTYPTHPYAAGTRGGGSIQSAPGLRRAGRYSGYGTSEDTRDYYLQMAALGAKMGPNLAMDLPTQCGYDSDNPLIRGDVGKVGVAIDSLRDMEIIFEAFQGDRDLDKIASNFTINAPANIIIGMFLALADNRGISWDKLKGTPQNDILKEFVSRGTYIFPPKHSMRMFRDSALFFVKHVPKMNITSIGGYHIREAGCTREQDLAFSMAIGMAYLNEGVEAGIDIDELASRFTFNAFGGSMEMLKEVAFQRAARRMWATILKERFGAKNPKSMIIRQPGGARISNANTTKQRPLNNLTRGVIGGVSSALGGAPPNVYPPFDEPLGLGWSLEAIQLSEDAGRILQYEAMLTEVTDPLAGSYYIEKLTDDIEAAAWSEVEKIEKMGGAAPAIESGYIQREVARSAYEKQKRIEICEDIVVGVNSFTDESDIEVTVDRVVDHPYDPAKREESEERQIKALKQLKKDRDNKTVSGLLKELEIAAKDEQKNLYPLFIECAKAYVTEGEMCDVLRSVFGEYETPSVF
ncbi:methylmalonyl-CoA mutase family protein [Thermodesulfobacteriota bacterium]